MTDQQLLDMYVRQELSTLEIGCLVGLCHTSVGRRLKRLGVALRGPGLIGRKNPNFVDGHSSTRYRKLIAKDKCSRCGCINNLGIHHKDGNHANNDTENLEVLCGTCHAKHHWNTDRKSYRNFRVCKRGHLLEGQVLVKDGKGYGSCRICHSLRVAAYKKRKKANCLGELK